MNCKFCGTPVTGKFCPHCGAPITAEPQQQGQQPPAYPTNQTPPQGYPPQQPGQGYGYQPQQGPGYGYQPPAAPPPKKKGKGLIIAVVAICLVLVIGAAVLLFTDLGASFLPTGGTPDPSSSPDSAGNSSSSSPYSGSQQPPSGGSQPSGGAGGSSSSSSSSAPGGSTSSAALEALLQTLDSVCEQSFGAGYYAIEYDSEAHMVIMDMWFDGVAEEVLALYNANAGPEAADWVYLKESIVYMYDSVRETANGMGLSDLGFMLNVLNDANLDNVLLSMVDGEFIYDVLA